MKFLTSLAGVALLVACVGCGDKKDAASPSDKPQAAANGAATPDANTNLVVLDIPGMT